MARQLMTFGMIFMVLVAGTVSAQAPASSPKAAPSPKASSSSSPAVSPVAASSPKALTVESPKASSGPVSAAAPTTVSYSPAFAPEGDYSSPPAPEDFEEGPAAGPVEGPVAADQPTNPADVPASAPTSKSAAATLELSAAVGILAASGFFLL